MHEGPASSIETGANCATPASGHDSDGEVSTSEHETTGTQTKLSIHEIDDTGDISPESGSFQSIELSNPFNHGHEAPSNALNTGNCCVVEVELNTIEKCLDAIPQEL